MGRGSLLCAKLRERIVIQFKYNVSQRKIANNLGLSLSIVHIIVKRFREAGEMSVRKGQGRQPLNACDHQALRRYCLRNHHSNMMDKSLSLNTVQEMQLQIVGSMEHVLISTCFWEKTDVGFYVPKMKKTIQTFTSEKCKSQPLWRYVDASVPTAWVICIYMKVPLMQRLMLEFWRDICCREHTMNGKIPLATIYIFSFQTITKCN